MKNTKAHLKGERSGWWSGLRFGLPLTTIIISYFLVLSGGVPSPDGILTGPGFGDLTTRLKGWFSLPSVHAQGNGGGDASGASPSSGGSAQEDAVTGEGPGGLVVTLRWKSSTQSYLIEANQPSTNYRLEPADSGSGVIAEGAVAPLHQWTVSPEAAAAMAEGGIRLTYQTAAGEVILNLSTSVITLGEINIPMHILPNKMYKLFYSLSRPMPDLSSLPNSQRPFIKMTVQGGHLNRTRTFFFPLESKKGGGEIIFILNHDEVEELNPGLKSKSFFQSSPVQISYQLYVENGTSFTVGDNTFHIDNTPYNLQRKVFFPLPIDTATDDATQSYLNTLSVTYDHGSSIPHYDMGFLTVTGAQPDDVLVCEATFSGFNGDYSSGGTRITMGIWQLALVTDSSSGNIPLHKVALPITPFLSINLWPGTAPGLYYYIVRQDSAQPNRFFFSGGTTFNGLTNDCCHGPLFAQVGKKHLSSFSGSTLPADNVQTAAVRIEPGFYNAAKGTRLYGVRLTANNLPFGIGHFSFQSSYPVWYLAESIESPLRSQHFPCSSFQQFHYHGLHYQHVNHAALMNYHLEAVDRDGDLLHVSYDPTYIDNGSYPHNIPYQDISQTFQTYGFRLELPSECHKYPVFLKIKARLRAVNSIVKKWGRHPPTPHTVPGGPPVPSVESCQVVMCPGQVEANAPVYEETWWIPVLPISVQPPANNCGQYDPHLVLPHIINAPFDFPLPISLPKGIPSFPNPQLQTLTCLNCSGPDASVTVPADSPLSGNGVNSHGPIITPDIIRKWVKSVIGETGTMDEWVHLHVKASFIQGSATFNVVFILRLHRPPVFFDQFVPKVATNLGVAIDADTPCPEYGETNPETGKIYNYPVRDNSTLYFAEEKIQVRFYYPGMPTRRVVYMSYAGLPFFSGFPTGASSYPYNRTNGFRVGIRPAEIPPGVNIWERIKGFGTVYKLSGAVDGDGQFVTPFHTILPRAGSYHNPEIHSTLGHAVVGDLPVSQTTNGCPEFPSETSVRITPAEPPPSNFPVNVTVEVDGRNYDYGVISGGMEPVIFFRNGSYQVQIPGGRNRRGITVSLYAEGCPTVVREILFPPLPVRPSGWRIAADPDYPVVQPAGVTQGQRLYWQGPTFQIGLKVLKNLAGKYQEKFGDKLPQTPALPSRKGTTQALNTKSTGVRWGDGW